MTQGVELDQGNVYIGRGKSHPTKGGGGETMEGLGAFFG